ncbi:hypothetical protein SE980_03200, partial [Legionella pneumophila]|nr:hypothetical protein [Legionella pneumophila]
EKMTLQNNFFRGIRLEGVKQKINNCRILDTGGSTVYENAFSIRKLALWFKDYYHLFCYILFILQFSDL